MQNQKQCPKCQGIPIDANAKVCPFDGTPFINTTVEFNQRLIPSNQPVSLNYYLLRAGIAIAVLFAIAFVLKSNQPVNNSSVNIQQSVNSNQPQIANANSTPLPSPSILSPKQNLELGKKLLPENIESAKPYLSAVPKGSKEYSSAQRALINLELQELAKDEQTLEQMTRISGSMDKTYGTKNMEMIRKRKVEIETRRKELERMMRSLP